jgi:hypothetical protein
MDTLSGVKYLKAELKNRGFEFDDDINMLFQIAFTKEITNLKILEGISSYTEYQIVNQNYLNLLTTTINTDIDG